MAELEINKTGFDTPISKLNALSARLRGITLKLESGSIDSSLTGEQEQKCMDELTKIAKDLAALADETAKDVAVTKAAYLLADSK